MKKKTPGEILSEYVPKPPSRFAWGILKALLTLMSAGKKPKYTYLFDRRELKGKPVMILADHASTDSYIYALLGSSSFRPNVVVGYHNVFRKGLFRLFLAAGVIPKRLYTPDFSTAVSILRLKKKGASFLLFPEGIQSMAGTTMPTDPATMALLKKLGLTTLLCRGYGAYLNRPRFDSSYRKGPMEFVFDVLFTEEEISTLTPEEMYAKYLPRFSYNDFEWNREKKYEYKGRHENAYGLDKILFVCPFCKGRFTLKTEGADLVCSCGNRVRVNRDYSLEPVGSSTLPFPGIDGWFLYQRALVRGDVSREDFSVSYGAEYQTLDEERLGNDRMISLGKGTVTVDRDKIRYEGTVRGEDKTIDLPVSLIPSAPFVSGRANEFFIDKNYYRFVPENDPKISVYVLLAVEELHNLADPDRRRVSEDVYGNEIIYTEERI